MLTKSTTLETSNQKPYSVIIERVSGTNKLLKIEDSNITNESVATARAKYELITKGMKKTEIEVTTYYQDLKINETIKVISPEYRIPEKFDRYLFKIKEVKHNFVGNIAQTTIKAVRYDID